MVILNRLSVVFMVFFAPLAVAMSQDQSALKKARACTFKEQIEQMPTYSLGKQDLDVYSSQNKAIKKVFMLHVALSDQNLRNIIFEYHGPEWAQYATLQASEFVYAYPPITSMKFNESGTELVVQTRQRQAVKKERIIWSLDTAKFQADSDYQWDPHFDYWAGIGSRGENYQLVTAVSPDDRIKGTFVVPGMKDFSADELLVTLAKNKLNILNAIIDSKPKRQDEDVSSSICVIQ